MQRMLKLANTLQKQVNFSSILLKLLINYLLNDIRYFKGILLQAFGCIKNPEFESKY